MSDNLYKINVIVMKNKFGIRLKELRERDGLSMKQLSKLVDIGIASISRWEKEQTVVNADQLIVFAKFFNVSIDFLVGLRDFD